MMSQNTDDRVNPYRFGVLEGNHVEDRFAMDHLMNYRVTANADPRIESHFQQVQ